MRADLLFSSYFYSDLLPNRDAADLTTNSSESFRVKRTCLTFEQRTALEDLFQRKKFINMNEKVKLAIELGVTKLEIQVLGTFSFFSCLFFFPLNQ